MEEIKNKVLNVINKQRNQGKVPQMGFQQFQHISHVPEDRIPRKTTDETDSAELQQSTDNEVLQSIEEIYFKDDVDTACYELEKLTKCEFDLQTIERNMKSLKLQQKVITKKMQKHIVKQQGPCKKEFECVQETEKQLQEAVWTCQKARAHLNFAKQHLTTNSLEIMAAYKKREVILQLLVVLRQIKTIKMTHQTFQELIQAGSYSEAIRLLLATKEQTEAYQEYSCIESFKHKISGTLIMTEVQLDGILNDLTTTFENRTYTEVQRSYKLLGKTLIAMDKLHMNFISAIHSTAFSVLKSYVSVAYVEESQKLVFEQICENIPADKYCDCLISLCKAFWKILVCYNQIVLWHQETKLDEPDDPVEEVSKDEYIQGKLKMGQFRMWNDVQGKICLYINSSRIHELEFEHFTMALAVMQRLKKVGIEFCGVESEKLMETIQKQSVEFFNRFHQNCLEEVALFVDHEAWHPIKSFTNLTELHEFQTVKRALRRHKNGPVRDTRQLASIPTSNDTDSMSQDESIYGSSGYFSRFKETSSPFDAGLDINLHEEDVLAGIADESSCYFSENSDECDVEQTPSEPQQEVLVCNASLTVLRCIGRYVQMCRLLHSITPKIVVCMTELIDYHVFAVYELFAKDIPVAKDSLYSALLDKNLRRIEESVIPKVKKWPPVREMIEADLKNPETVYGLAKRVLGVESCIHLVGQFEQLQGYLLHLLSDSDASEHPFLEQYCNDAKEFTADLRKPTYMCSIARVVDVSQIMLQISKVKFDTQDVATQHSNYSDNINRSVQFFAMRLDKIPIISPQPRAAIWNNLAHVITHILVDGYSIAKKCSLGGRALMQLDFTHILVRLQLISNQKFPEHQAYVEQYVKAYYLPKDLLEEFIRNQKSYSAKHLTGLINCTCSNDKKTRQMLLGLVETTPNGDN